MTRLLLFVCLFWPGVVLAAPSISGTTGTVTHGSSITIAGTGFGAKGGTNANKPLIWADFESSINPTSLGHLTAWAGNQNLSRNVGGTQYTNSGANVVGTRSAGVQAFDFQIVHTFSSKLYMSGKRRFSAFNTSANFKYFRMWNDAPSSLLATNLSDGTIYDESFTTQDNRFQGVQPSANVWRMEEFLWRKATNACGTSPVVANGYWRMDVNATTQQLHNSQLCSNLSANYGQYLGLSIFDNFDTNENLANGTNIWMDDFYVDDTWARVVVGNASTLSASTVREMQIPSAWSDTSITVTVNRGSFGATDTVYLYVIDANDVASPGVAVTFGSGSEACTGTSPTLVAASPSYTAVNNCLATAVDGDTITVPSGSATWTSTLVWTNKSITLKGAGIGSTNIRADVTGTYPCLMNITLKPTGNSPAGFTRITGFTFQPPLNCGDNTPNTPDGMIGIKGDSLNFRFDHNRVESGDYSGGLAYTEYVRGVADHNEFVSLAPTVNRKSIVCWHTKWDTTTVDFGDSSWAKPSTVGTLNQLIFEDNLYDRSTSPNGLNAFNDEYAGCRSTHRFNTMANAHPATHGFETSQRILGFRHNEVYRNTTTTHPTGQDSAVKFRDGSGMIFDNVVTPNIASRFGALITLRREDDGSHANDTWTPWGACGAQGSVVSMTRSGSTVTVVMSQNQYIPTLGAWVLIQGADQAEYNKTVYAIGSGNGTNTFTYPVTGTPATPATGTITIRSPFDGNTDATGWPCFGQVGRGEGQLYTGSTSSITPTTAANQVSQPVYCFNNTIAGTVLGCEATYGADVILEEREFYNQKSSFTGAAGVGRGLRSARPATCTTGVGYWSTDGGGDWNALGEDGALDKCTATNTWANDWYVPPPYPHPLNVSDAGGGSGLGSWIPQGTQPMVPMLHLR